MWDPATNWMPVTEALPPARSRITRSPKYLICDARGVLRLAQRTHGGWAAVAVLYDNTEYEIPDAEQTGARVTHWMAPEPPEPAARRLVAETVDGWGEAGISVTEGVAAHEGGLTSADEMYGILSPPQDKK